MLFVFWVGRLFITFVKHTRSEMYDMLLTHVGQAPVMKTAADTSKSSCFVWCCMLLA